MIKILNTAQIRALDAFTIQKEPVTSIDLMERASRAFVQRFVAKHDPDRPVWIFCGKGNNGGDGLAIGRILNQKMYSVRVFTVEYTTEATRDYQHNLERLKNHLLPERIAAGVDLPPRIPEETVIVDALLGSGLTRPVSGLLQAVIEWMNQSARPIVSVDIASGLYADRPNSQGDTIVRPACTISFQLPKAAFFMPDNASFVGSWEIADIGLDAGFIDSQETTWFMTSREYIPQVLHQRGKFSHKGSFGHALVMAGSYGKIGAALLAGKSCLRSGAGLLTMYIPECGYSIMQTALPEAMVLTDSHFRRLTEIPSLEGYSAVGVGPGIGTEPETVAALTRLLEQYRGRLVLDADALNILALHPRLLERLPENTVLTPHPKEFQRLAGHAGNDYDRIRLLQEFTQRYRVVVCLKGAHTAVALPDKRVYFNNSGNPGMATGGSGDVLTGIITALLAQGYKPEEAARIAVFKHGEAGDHAASFYTQPAMIASDIIEHLRW